MAGSGSALVASLMSAAQDVEFLERKNVALKKEFEQMKKENELVQRKFEIEASERLKLQKECEEFKVLISRLREKRDGFEENEDYYQQERIKLEKKICEGEQLKELNSRLREERDGLLNRLEVNEDYYQKERFKLEKKMCLWKKLKELAFRLRDERDKLRSRLKEKENDHREIIEVKRNICELECENLKAKTDADVYRKSFEELEGKVLIMNVEKHGSTNSGDKSKANTKSSKLSVMKKPLKPVRKMGRALKEPNKPKRPPSAFFVFMEEFRETYKKEHPKNRCLSAVGKAAGDKWILLSEAEKAHFVFMSEKRKVEYEKKMIAYNSGRAEEEPEVDKSESEVNDDGDLVEEDVSMLDQLDSEID